MKKKRWKFPLMFLLLFGLLFFLSDQTALAFDARNLKWELAGSAVLAGLLALTQLRKKRAYAGVEHGSARYGTKRDIAPLIDPEFSRNILLSDTERLSMDMRATRLNCHVLVLGGSGSGKSRYYVKPNVMQRNASYVITDPSGEHLRDEGKMLQDAGYDVRVFDTVHLKGHFNPFAYFRSPKDIRRFIETLMANTSGDQTNPQHNEDFWTKSERLWLMAHIAYLMETCEPEEFNIPSLTRLLNASEAREDDEGFQSAVDILFQELEEEHPESFAVKQYKKYKLAAGKTAKSILISIGVRLADFDIPEVSEMFRYDGLELDRLGDRRSALFLIVDDVDTTYNYMAAILLNTMFHALVKKADDSPQKHLDVPVRCILDEIANIGRIPNTHILVSVLRKRWIGMEFLFQNLDQMKALYKDHWATIESNCDTALFLGGKGENTAKYVSGTLLGKATIDTVSYTGSGGMGTLGKNSYSSQEQKAGRNLLDENEVPLLSTDECIVSIRTLPPFKSRKFRTEQHANYKLLADSNPQNAFSLSEEGDLSQAKYITEIILEDY